MSLQLWGDILTWGTIAQWITIAAIFLYDSVRMHGRINRQYKLAVEIGNGRILTARFRRKISRWYVLGSGIAFSLGILSTYSNLFLPHAPPDTRIVGAVIREGIIVMLFAFWRTKRANLVLQREIDELTEGELIDIAQDTNVRIREIQQRGQSDAPAEKLDREEGREHREKKR